MIDPVQKAHTDRLTGIALMCAAVFLFAGNDATAKYLNGHMHTIEVVWARYMSAFVLAVSQMAIQYSRDGNNYVGALFASLLLFYFLERGLERKRQLDYVLAGFAAGYCVTVYIAARLTPPASLRVLQARASLACVVSHADLHASLIANYRLTTPARARQGLH